jgi:uncharacterized membrane protein YkvA (DUF1232 family)
MRAPRGAPSKRSVNSTFATTRAHSRIGLSDEPGGVEKAGAAAICADLRPLPGLPPPEDPLHAKAFAALIVGYVVSPIDSIPDFIPGIGLLYEMVVVPISVWVAAKMVPNEVFEECPRKVRAVARGEEPVSRAAAVVVVIAWLSCAALAAFLAAKVLA